MKAIEYKALFDKHIADGAELLGDDAIRHKIVGLCRVAVTMLKEAFDLAEKRKAHCDSAIVAVFREAGQKWKAFASSCGIEKDTSPMQYGLFETVIKDQMPKTYEALSQANAFPLC